MLILINIKCVMRHKNQKFPNGIKPPKKFWRQFIWYSKVYHRRVKMKKNVFFAGIPAIMLVFGLLMASCETETPEPDPPPPHVFEYKLSSGTLTITGEGESSKPKTGDSFTLVTADGKKATGTIEVAEDGTITFRNKNGDKAFPDAKIEGDDLKIEKKGEIIFDGDGGKGEQPVETAKPPSYKMSWAYMGGPTYDEIRSQAEKDYGISFKPAGSNAGYLTGAEATGSFAAMKTQLDDFDATGTKSGSFEDLLNFKDEESGIGLPEAVKSTLSAQKAKIPIAAVFQVSPKEGGTGIVVIYVEEDKD
jgi:hypothetical protein